jgi:tetratricopeptide (TPR) repeat protein
MSDALDLTGMWQNVQALMSQGRYAESAAALREALAQLGCVTAPELTATRAELLSFLGVAESAQGHWAEAKSAFGDALNLLGPPLPETAFLRVTCLQGLGDAAYGQNQFDAAERHYQEAIDLYRLLSDVLGWRKVVQATSQRAGHILIGLHT